MLIWDSTMAYLSWSGGDGCLRGYSSNLWFYRMLLNVYLPRHGSQRLPSVVLEIQTKLKVHSKMKLLHFRKCAFWSYLFAFYFSFFMTDAVKKNIFVRNFSFRMYTCIGDIACNFSSPVYTCIGDITCNFSSSGLITFTIQIHNHFSCFPKSLMHHFPMLLRNLDSCVFSSSLV